ncbi:MAG: peptidyl-prolyl cis-trans isomerase [Bryobacteraceae bacterium]|nr:peptidyl-prolyl cis-trans isomerase [Bryobacteraceae bacterium]
MFDLFRSRDKAVRYLIGGLLGLVALSMVITLIPGFGSAQAGNEQIVAEIGGEPLTVREVQATLQMALRNRQVPQEMMSFYLPQVVDNMITERAVAYQAKRMGFKITDEEVGNAIRSMLMQYFPTGEIPDTAYRQFLQQQGQDVDRFEKNVRMNLLMLRLSNLAMEGAIVTPDEVEKEFHRKNDKIKVQYVKYTPPANLRDSVTVTPAEVQGYYQSQKSSFNTPEKRTLDILLADEAKIAASFQVPEQELRALYSSQIDKFRTGERAHVRHILVKTTEKPKEELPKLEAKANDLLKQIRGGADFADLAKKNSDDPGSGAQGGDLNWIVKGQTVPAFETAAFSLKPKEISNIIKTEYGFHILQVLEKEEARVRPFEEVRGQLAAERQREAIQNRMQQSIDQARAELARTPDKAQEVAGRLGLSYIHAEKVGQSDSIPELGSAPEIETAVAGAKAGQVSQIFQSGQNKLGIAVVRQVFPAHPAEFAEVESQVRDRLIADKAAKLGEQKLKEATDKLKAAGGDLAAAAKQLGTTVKEADFFTLDTAAEGIGPGSYMAEGFNKATGTVMGPFSIGGDVVLAKTIDKQTADVSKLSAEREELVVALKRKRAGMRKELFEDGIMTQLIKEGKVKKYNDSITRLLANYRS